MTWYMCCGDKGFTGRLRLANILGECPEWNLSELGEGKTGDGDLATPFRFSEGGGIAGS